MGVNCKEKESPLCCSSSDRTCVCTSMAITETRDVRQRSMMVNFFMAFVEGVSVQNGAAVVVQGADVESEEDSGRPEECLGPE